MLGQKYVTIAQDRANALVARAAEESPSFRVAHMHQPEQALSIYEQCTRLADALRVLQGHSDQASHRDVGSFVPHDDRVAVERNYLTITNFRSVRDTVLRPAWEQWQARTPGLLDLSFGTELPTSEDRQDGVKRDNYASCATLRYKDRVIARLELKTQQAIRTRLYQEPETTVEVLTATCAITLPHGSIQDFDLGSPWAVPEVRVCLADVLAGVERETAG